MLVKDLMTTSVTCVRPDMPVAAVIKIMKGEDVGIVPVCDIQNHLLGVITDRDIIMRDGLNKTAGEIMTAEIFTAEGKDNIHDAALKMSCFGIRRLPVLENGRLSGILSISDIASRKIYTAEIGHIIYNISNKKN